LLAWYDKYQTVPMHMASGFAAYIMFSKAVIKEEGEVYFGLRDGEKYKIDDANASYFYNLWQDNRTEEVIDKILGNKNLWDADLTKFHGFAVAVKDFFNQFTKEEFKYVITRLSQGGKIAHEI
jgi:tagaturonate reductase